MSGTKCHWNALASFIWFAFSTQKKAKYYLEGIVFSSTNLEQCSTDKWSNKITEKLYTT